MNKTHARTTLLILLPIFASCGEGAYDTEDYSRPSEDVSRTEARDASMRQGEASAPPWREGASSNAPYSADAAAAPGAQWDAGSREARDGAAQDAGRWDASWQDASSVGDASASDSYNGDAGWANDAQAAGNDSGAGALDCQQLSYRSFGEDFLSEYCVDCHGRRNARADVRLDSLDGLIARRAAAKSAVVSGKMPQGNKKPSDGERADFGRWIDCGPK